MLSNSRIRVISALLLGLAIDLALHFAVDDIDWWVLMGMIALPLSVAIGYNHDRAETAFDTAQRMVDNDRDALQEQERHRWMSDGPPPNN